MDPQTFTFASSPFVLVRHWFLGWGTGHFIWGGQALFDFPKTGPEVNRTLGLRGFWMPGFMPVSHGYLAVDRIDVVLRIQQSGSLIHGGPRLHGLWHSLVCDGSPTIYRFQRPVGWLDGHRDHYPPHGHATERSARLPQTTRWTPMPSSRGRRRRSLRSIDS
jgi:hypothetical protein